MAKNKFVPTTEAVREVWCRYANGDYLEPTDREWGANEAEFVRWHRAELARAWDEGWTRGWGAPPMAPILGNPYRSAP